MGGMAPMRKLATKVTMARGSQGDNKEVQQGLGQPLDPIQSTVSQMKEMQIEDKETGGETGGGEPDIAMRPAS
ncbi:hypothetical protein FRC11_007888, partial [Ceratobasidium sp. 423]